MNNQRGLTLFEVVSCMVIVGILSGMAIPVFRAMIVRNRFLTETSKVFDAFKIAKSYAIASKSPVVFAYDQHGYKVFVDDGAGGGVAGDNVLQAGEKMLFDGDLSSKGIAIDVNQSTFTGQRTRFSGKPAIKAGSLVLTDAAGSKTRIVVNIMGRVRTEKIM